MNTTTMNCTYGSAETPAEMFVTTTDYGTWYSVVGSVNVNCTFEEFEDGVDIESLSDVDTFTCGGEIPETEEEFERHVSEYCEYLYDQN